MLTARIHILLLFVAIGLVGGVQAQDATVPPETKRLLDLLKKFEEREKVKFEEIVNRKRKDVLVALRKQLKSKTRDGKLEQALLIQEEIKKLEKHVTKKWPEKLIGKIKAYKKNGVSYTGGDIPSRLIIDGDQEQGKLILEFEHPQLSKMLSSRSKARLEFKISTAETSESSDTVVARSNNLTLGKKRGVEKGEKVNMQLDVWKVSRISDKIEIAIECIGGDGFIIDSSDKQNFFLWISQ